MLKFFGHTGNGVPLILLGLSAENVARLMADEPIMVHMPQAAAGLPGMPTCMIVLVGGETEEDIAEQVATSEVAQFLRDNPATPDRPVTIIAARKKPTDG